MDLDFKLDNTQYLTHGIHPYPAKMIPQVANKLIQEYGRKANVLFDPFCGSGTVLLEAKLNNIHSIGFELNPLARLIASVKTTNIEQRTLELFLKDFHNYIFEIIYYPQNHKPVVFRCPNIDYWFSKKVQRNLTLIKTYINTIDNQQVKNFFLVAFGKTVRLCSWTRNDEFKLYKMPIEKIRHFKPDVFSIMEQTLAQNYLGITQFANVVNNEIISNIYNANSSKYIPKRLIKDESVDLVITSPPYGDSATTVSYGQFSALPNEWIFEMTTSRNLDKILMGGLKAKRINSFASDILNAQISEMAKIDIKRTLEITGFYRDYFKSIRNISKTVKKQGFVCYVVSNRTVCGIKLKTDQITIDFFKSQGLKHIQTFERKISNKRLPQKNRICGVGGCVSDLMNKEFVIVMQR